MEAPQDRTAVVQNYVAKAGPPQDGECAGAHSIPGQNKRKHNSKKSKGEDSRMKLNGSEIVIECLKEQGVDTVFVIRAARF